MNGGEKWNFLGYPGGSQDNTVISPVMLRFRPIAPKPVAGETSYGGLQFDNKKLLLCKTRAKRKYVRVRKNNIRRKKRSSLASDHDQDQDSSNNPERIVTLQLLPEKTEANIRSVNNEHGAVSEENNNIDLLSLFNLNSNNRWIDRMGPLEEPDRSVLTTQKRVKVVESWVTVECVMETCMGGRGFGRTDVERLRILEINTCPGFISDGLNRVQWVNGAYKRMLMMSRPEGLVSQPEIMVWLSIKQELPRFCSAFSCKVRLQFTWEKEKCSKLVPCDVWKMDGDGCSGDGFAWRLDMEAALSLGR